MSCQSVSSAQIRNDRLRVFSTSHERNQSVPSFLGTVEMARDTFGSDGISYSIQQNCQHYLTNFRQSAVVPHHPGLGSGHHVRLFDHVLCPGHDHARSGWLAVVPRYNPRTAELQLLAELVC